MKVRNVEEPPGGLFARIAFLAPFAGGLSVGLLILAALSFPEVAERFWHGARLAEGAPTAAVRTAALAVPVVAALVMWLAMAIVFERGMRLERALGRWALPFVPLVSILILYLTDIYAVPLAMVFSVHLTILSAALFLGITTALLAAREKPPAANLLAALERKAFPTVLVLAAVYCLVFSGMGILQYFSLNISYTDTADWEQMLWNTLHGRFLETSAFPHMFFGEHVQFVQLFLLPFYALVPSLVTLMVIKSVALASGAVPVYLLARRRLGSKAAAVFFAAAYLLYPALQYVDMELVYNTFRPVAFAIPALLWAVYCADRDKPAGFAVAAFFALASKEEMALPVAMLGVLLLLRRRWVWGGVTFAVAAAWFLAAVLWVIPHFRGGATHMYLYYQDFGTDLTFGRLLWRVVSDPLHTLAVAFRPIKIDYLLLLLVPLGLRPLFSWRMMLVISLSLATALLASREPSFTIYYHYQAALVPMLAAGAVYGASNCRGILSGLRLFLPTAGAEARRRAALAGLTVLVFVSALFGNVLFAQSPISLLFYNWHMETYWRNRYVPNDRSCFFFRKVRPRVPQDARVSATEFLATYFAARREIYVFPENSGNVDYIVIDTKDRWLEARLEDAGTTLEAALSIPAYEKVLDEQGFLLLHRHAAEVQPP